MKAEFKILYKNGHEDTVVVDITDSETALGVVEVRESVNMAMREDISAVVEIGDGDTNGSIIRVSDVSRFGMTMMEGEKNE